jgi:hypothetical protein
VRFSARRVQKHHSRVFEKSMSKGFCKKFTRKQTNRFLVVRLFLSLCLAVFLHRKLKNATKMLNKLNPKKKEGGMYRAFS